MRLPITVGDLKEFLQDIPDETCLQFLDNSSPDEIAHTYFNVWFMNYDPYQDRLRFASRAVPIKMGGKGITGKLINEEG